MKVGGALSEPNRSVIEAASWALASTLARRHPELTVRRDLSGGGGQYDCLGIRSDSEQLHIDLNRNGRIHIHSAGGGVSDWEPVAWTTYMAADPREFVEFLEDRCRLPHVAKLPATTPRTLTYRLLSAFAQLHTFRTLVEIEMSWIDGYGSGPADWLTGYPELARRAGGEPYEFWRASSRDSEFVMETERALLHRRDGSTQALATIYDDLDRNFTRLLGHVLATESVA